MAETRLFPSEKCAGFFGTKRFDRRKNADGRSVKSIHATTVNGNGVNPGMEDILAVAEQTGIGKA